MSSVIKMKGSKVWIKDHGCLRTDDEAFALNFPSKKDASDFVSESVTNNKILAEKWEVAPGKVSEPGLSEEEVEEVPTNAALENAKKKEEERLDVAEVADAR